MDETPGAVRGARHCGSTREGSYYGDGWRLALRRDYRSMVPVVTLIARIRECPECTELSLEQQELIFNEVVCDALCRQFPPSVAYRKRFLKALIDLIQEKDEEIYEPLLELYMELLQSQEEREACYKTFAFPVGQEKEERTVTIRIAQEFHVVGLAEWEAGFYLAEFILAHQDNFKDRICLELGSGIGLTGLVLAGVGPKQVILSDYLEDPVLANLRLNVHNSGYEVHPLLPGSQDASTPEVNIEQLDWMSFSEEKIAQYQPDWIFAADVFYDPCLVDACLDVVLSLLLRNPEATVLIASTIRNEKTFAGFLTKAPTMGLEVTTAALQSSPASLCDQLPFTLPPSSSPVFDTSFSTETVLPPLFPYVRENKIIIINAIRLKKGQPNQEAGPKNAVKS